MSKLKSSVFEDLGQLYIDKDENGLMDTANGEYLAGLTANGTWDGNTYVRFKDRIVFVLSDSRYAPRLQVDRC